MKKMKTFIRENTWLQRGFINCGWGNGYVLIPEGHPLHGEHYDKIDVDVNGGLTFSELVDDDMIETCGLNQEDKGMWCVGFDTAHGWDTLEDWPKEAVQAETVKLLEQLSSYEEVS